MDATYYEEIAGLLRGLLIRTDDRVRDGDIATITEFIDVNELGLALEDLVYALAEDDMTVDDDERNDMLVLADRMHIAEDVRRTLAFCPRR